MKLSHLIIIAICAAAAMPVGKWIGRQMVDNHLEDTIQATSQSIANYWVRLPVSKRDGYAETLSDATVDSCINAEAIAYMSYANRRAACRCYGNRAAMLLHEAMVGNNQTFTRDGFLDFVNSWHEIPVYRGKLHEQAVACLTR